MCLPAWVEAAHRGGPQGYPLGAAPLNLRHSLHVPIYHLPGALLLPAGAGPTLTYARFLTSLLFTSCLPWLAVDLTCDFLTHLLP